MTELPNAKMTTKTMTVTNANWSKFGQSVTNDSEGHAGDINDILLLIPDVTIRTMTTTMTNRR